MDLYKKAETTVDSIFLKYHSYKNLLAIMQDDFNDYPYQSANLVREKGVRLSSNIPMKVELIDKYTCYIDICDRIVSALDEDSRKLMINSYVLKRKKWWEEEYISDSTYYRRRKKAILSFYELYSALCK